MIEALTPQLLLVGMLLATLIASLLTLVASAIVLWAYRRRVLRAMQQHGAAMPWPHRPVIEQPPVMRAGLRAVDAERAARRAPRVVVGAGFALALVFVGATLMALPTFRTPGRLLLVLWVLAWPIVPALWFAAPLRRRSRVLLAAAPFVLWALASLALQAVDRSLVEYFYVVTPLQALAVWLFVNLPPTLMWWLFGNRRLRAVGPLVLGFATALAAGGLTLTLWLLATSAGNDWLTRAAAVTSWPRGTLVGLAMLALVVASGAVGWVFMRRARAACAAKHANDRSLRLAALALLFAVWYAMLLVLGGIEWLLAAPLALGAAWLVTRLARQPASAPAGVSLVFLRVFGLGRRSDELFDRIARNWRHLAPIDLIVGPDIVHGTVQPHQLMDFLSGRLTSHFVTDAASLAERLQARDVRPDSDGRHRVNSFFCHADTWTHVLAALVAGPVVVLMDLRGLTPDNSGCVQELHHLVDAVALQRCVFVVDDSTDRYFLQATLTSAWRSMAQASPNREQTPQDVALHDLARDDEALRGLLGHLCAATR